MKEYKADLKDLRDKIVFVERMSKIDLSEEDKIKVARTMTTLIYALELNYHNDPIFNKIFLSYVNNGMDISKETKQVANNGGYLDENRLKFILELLNNMSVEYSGYFDYMNIGYTGNPNYMPMNVKDIDMETMTCSFFKQLDSDIYSMVQQILFNLKAVSTTKIKQFAFPVCGCETGYDYIHNKLYITIIKENTLQDLFSLGYGLMQGIEYCTIPKTDDKIQMGYRDVAAITIQYLLADYLESKGIDKRELEKYIIQNQAKWCKSAHRIRKNIMEDLEKKGLNIESDCTLENVKPSILEGSTHIHINNIEAAVMGYGFYKQIKDDEQKGLENLKKFIYSDISKDKSKDFSEYGLSSEVLLELSREIGTKIKSEEQIINSSSHRRK